jgi:hypothetical protein
MFADMWREYMGMEIDEHALLFPLLTTKKDLLLK